MIIYLFIAHQVPSSYPHNQPRQLFVRPHPLNEISRAPGIYDVDAHVSEAHRMNYALGTCKTASVYHGILKRFVSVFPQLWIYYVRLS